MNFNFSKEELLSKTPLFLHNFENSADIFLEFRVDGIKKIICGNVTRKKIVIL